MPDVLTSLGSAHCVVVANPAAAGVTPAVVDAVQHRLTPCVRSLRTVFTPAVRLDADVVVTVGGDGTVADLLPVLTPGQLLCPLPAGSGNSTARNLFGERDWRAVLDLLATPGALATRQLDLLHLLEPDALALLGVSTGFLADVLIKARDVEPAISGIDRYYTAAVDVLDAMPDHPTRVSVDGRLISAGPTASVAIGGGRFRARSFNFLPWSVLDDGLLDVSTIAALDPPAVADLVTLMPTGSHLARPEVRYARGRRVVVERSDGAPLVAEWDGTVWETAGNRLTVDVLPRALTVLCDPATVEGDLR